MRHIRAEEHRTVIFMALIAAGVAALAGAAAAHLAHPPPTQPPAAAPASFDGAKLGMTVGEWKSLAPPPGVGPSAAADCGKQVVAALRADQIAAAPLGPGRTTCAYDARFGRDVLLHSARLDARYRIDGLRYRFTSGRLGEVDFTASIDAYNDIVAALTREYGPPTATVRDVVRTAVGRFPRVRQTWRAAGGVVSLTDPTDDPLRLGVRIASDRVGG
jgi:hypothetical protein